MPPKTLWRAAPAHPAFVGSAPLPWTVPPCTMGLGLCGWILSHFPPLECLFFLGNACGGLIGGAPPGGEDSAALLRARALGAACSVSHQRQRLLAHLIRRRRTRTREHDSRVSLATRFNPDQPDPNPHPVYPGSPGSNHVLPGRKFGRVHSSRIRSPGRRAHCQ